MFFNIQTNSFFNCQPAVNIVHRQAFGFQYPMMVPPLGIHPFVAARGIQQPFLVPPMGIPPFDDVRVDGGLDRRLGAVESRFSELVLIGKLQAVSKIKNSNNLKPGANPIKVRSLFLHHPKSHWENYIDRVRLNHHT